MTDEDRRISRWHWLWYAPVLAWLLSLVEWHTVGNAFLVLRLFWRRWDWGALISPSAAFCLSVVLASVFLPINGVIATTAVLFDPHTNRRTVAVRTLLLLVAISLLPFVTDALIWGSFPFSFEHGVGRLRMIPFFPWPDRPYGDF